MEKTRGFTLLEVMVAVAIFAIVSTVTVASLQNVARHQSSYKQHQEDLLKFDRTLFWLQRDLSQFVFRVSQVQDSDRSFEPEIMSVKNGLEWSVLSSDRVGAPVKRVRYTVDSGRLLRRLWDSVDRASETGYSETILLSDVAVDITFLASDGARYSSWPLQDSDTKSDVPLTLDGVEFRFELAAGLRVKQSFAILAKGLSNAAQL